MDHRRGQEELKDRRGQEDEGSEGSEGSQGQKRREGLVKDG